MKKRFALILSLLMLLSIFCSCGSKDSSYSGEQNPGNETSDDSQSDISKDAVSTEESPEKKIIKTYHLTLESTNFKEDAALIVSAAEALGGYISESSETKAYSSSDRLFSNCSLESSGTTPEVTSTKHRGGNITHHQF